MLQSFNITGTLFTGQVPPRRSREDAAPLWNVYRCRDGGWIALSMAQLSRWWAPFCDAIGRPDLRDDPRFCALPAHMDHRRELIAELDRVFAAKDQWEWVEELCGQGLPVAPVQDYAQVIRDPQVVANDYIVEYDHRSGERRKMVGPAVQLGATPGRIARGAPEFDEHTEQVLLEFGFSWDDIQELRGQGAIGAR